MLLKRLRNFNRCFTTKKIEKQKENQKEVLIVRATLLIINNISSIQVTYLEKNNKRKNKIEILKLQESSVNLSLNIKTIKWNKQGHKESRNNIPIKLQIFTKEILNGKAKVKSKLMKFYDYNFNIYFV